MNTSVGQPDGLGAQVPAASPVRWDHVVWGCIKMGRPETARTLAEHVAASQPGNAPVLEALGYVAAAEHRYDEARRDFEHAIALRPQSHLAHYNLAKTWLALGERARAAEDAATAARLNPSSGTEALLREATAPPP